jgi:hypothetical protein
MEILGKEIGVPAVKVGLQVMYQDNKGIECPAIVTAVSPAAPGSKEPNVDLTVFSTNPGATNYLAGIAFGTSKGSYNFIK